ncbi:PREDICTED: E3 ubiquitin-protein ligase RNF167-like, partial [Buceros rhinoceros silvestris]|uniref:E3 ubiquitin-protein ligase RNF167-like n=1 Tax=Buceros rhinoceros silvestris TaxID=175836 RepID=UPI000528B30D
QVLRAWQAGYQTALVYKVDSEQPITMMAGDKDTQQLIKIPPLLPGQAVSLHLQRISQCEKGAYIRLLPLRHSQSPRQDDTKILQETPTVQHFKDIFYVIISTISMMVGLSCYLRAHMTKLHMYKQGDKYKTCAICLEEYKEGDSLKVLSCSHAFHSACIDTWFHIQEICPFCRQLVNTYGEGDPAGGAGDDVDEEEQDHEGIAFGERHEN